MGYDFHNFYGKKIHRNQWGSDILDKAFYLLFNESYYRTTPISFFDCLYISKRLKKLIKVYNDDPNMINSILIQSDSEYFNSFRFNDDAIDYLKKIARFFKFSKGIISEEQYFKCFYPKVCECSDFLKFSHKGTKFYCKTCEKEYNLICVILTIFRKPIIFMRMIFRFLFGFVLKSEHNFKKIKEGYI